jgi:choline kinase
MSYRVCIPTAGTGSRLGSLTKYVNKSLVGIANRPTLSHLVEQFPHDSEFVIALGHKGHLVREFLELAYPKRRFYFSDVSPFEGPGSGLGLSLLSCREHLQQPFVFISCDTLVREAIPAPDTNWMAYAELSDITPYRTVEAKDGVVARVCEKGEGKPGTHHAYIGLAGIHDYQAFWASMVEGGNTAIETGEAHGLRHLLDRKIAAHCMTWHDTGNPDALARTREIYQEPDAPTILEKANEAIWFVGDQVIKFSDDEKFIANRVQRVEQMSGFVPELTGSRPHMYRYVKAEGTILSDAVTLPLFGRLLDYSERFWARTSLDAPGRKAFQSRCLKFYREKTFERVALFFKNFSRQDGTESINGVPMPTVDRLLNAVDWNWLADGLAGRFHGDFHFENILWSPASERFVFLDWRQDFGGDLAVGDIYYDLAKLMHGLIVSHQLIAADRYSVDWKDNTIDFDLHRKQILVQCERHFEKWLSAKGYDTKKVRTLTALIYLNIAALHHYPYSLLLLALGKSMLKEELDTK